MHLLIVSRGIPTTTNFLNGIFEWDQAKALYAEGLKVTFVVLDLRSIRRRRKLTTQVYSRDGIDVIYGALPLGSLPHKLFFKLGCWKLRKLINLAIRTFGIPDVIHGHFTAIGAMAATIATELKIPSVITEHSSALNLDNITARTFYFGQIAYSKATKIISVSKKLQERIFTHFGYDSTIVHNVVDIDSIKFNKNENKPLDKFIFVSVGNLLRRKGHDLLVSAFSQLPDGLSELYIIGGGPEEERLQLQINDLNKSDSIKLLGRKTRQEISDIMAQADCFVLASRRETFGVVYIEAMLAGLPVIATRCGGPEDFVNNTNGLLIDTDNVDQLKESLSVMIKSANNYSSKIIHDFAEHTFGPETIAKKLIETYNSCL